MKWINSNERRPDKQSWYYTEDTAGAKALTHFYQDHWHSMTGSPVAKWLDESASNGGKEDVKAWLLNYCDGNFPGDFTVNEVVEIIIAYSPVPSLGVSAEEMISDAQEILYLNVPANCYDNELQCLVNCPEKYVLNAMSLYASSRDDTIRELKKQNKEIGRIKNHFTKVCSENKKKYSDNTAILVFIQQMEESITWVNQV